MPGHCCFVDGSAMQPRRCWLLILEYRELLASIESDWRNIGRPEWWATRYKPVVATAVVGCWYRSMELSISIQSDWRNIGWPEWWATRSEPASLLARAAAPSNKTPAGRDNGSCFYTYFVASLFVGIHCIGLGLEEHQMTEMMGAAVSYRLTPTVVLSAPRGVIGLLIMNEMCQRVHIPSCMLVSCVWVCQSVGK